MKVLIIEDEKPAADKLVRLLNNQEYPIEILSTLTSVTESLNWLQKNLSPDLIFMDIQLEDGTCFDIFEAMKISIPVIFTTAYDQYALKAFKVNSVDYLLKPVDPGELKMALQKYVTTHFQSNNLLQLEAALKQLPKNRKERFLVKVGDHFKSIPTTDINCFYIEERCTFLNCREGKSYGIDYSLDKVEEMVNPDRFFRVNRNFIVNFSSICDVLSYSSSRLKVKLTGVDNNQLILVSRERVRGFKDWMDR